MIHQVSNSRTKFNYNAFIYEDIEWKTHFHKNFELVYSIEGEHTVYIDRRAYTIEAGELILIPPNMLHSLVISKNARAWVGVFSADYVALFAKTESDKQYSKFRCSETVESYLKQVLFYQGTPERYMIKSALYAVMCECLKNAHVVDRIANMDDFNEILDYIAKNYDKPMTMSSVAKELGYEYHYFSSVFHKCFSMNFKEYLNLHRFERACELMAHSECSLTEIAMASGFQSIRSFNYAFKSISGMTPTEYRRSFR